MENPWTGDLDRYLFYNCPECDEKSENKDLFIGHAVTTHPNAKEILYEYETVMKLEEPESPMNNENEGEFDVHIKVEPSDELGNVINEVDVKDIPTFEDPLAKETDTASDQPSVPKCVPRQNMDGLKDKRRKVLILKVEDLKGLKCTKCQEYFSSKKCLQEHQQEYHPNEVSRYQQDSKKEVKMRKAEEKRVKQEYDKYSEKGYQKDEAGQWCCRVCDRKYTNIRSLKKHEMSNHNDILKIGIECDRCKFRCKEEKTMEAHKATKHKPKFKCDLCDYIPDAYNGGREYSLKVHMIRKHGEQNFEGTKCDKCDVEYATNEAMIRHLKSAHNVVIDDEIKCEVCGNNFGKRRFMYHQRYSHGIYPSGFKCILCDEFLNSEKEEVDHQAEFHSKDLQCDKCKVNFDTIPPFNDHLADCLDDPKSFKCKECDDDYVWFSTNVLRIHWAKVHKLHRLICEVCGFHATQKSELKRHMKERHSENNKQHQCHHCGKSFARPFKLKIHLSKDHDEDTYCPTCKYCGKKFKDKKSMANHVNGIHEKTTKYPCQYCDFWSWYPLCLKAHVNVKHKNHKTIPCGYCDKGFVANRERDKHIASRHPDAIEKNLI